MNCTYTNDDGTKCGAEWASERPAFTQSGNIKTPRTCTAGHNRATWLDGKVWRQSANGRPRGVCNKSAPIGARYSTAFLSRLEAAGWTVQAWASYTESLDIPDVR